MSGSDFDRSVFVNWPFDEGFEPILQGMLFCLIYFGFAPRLAKERSDSTEIRLEKIIQLIEASRYSIHDLSRCQSTREGEYYRLNMPFELGIDYGCKRYSKNDRERKKILILEERNYRYQATISDLAGCDIEFHGGDYQKAIRKVRNWLVAEADAAKIGTSKVLNAYTDFQEWYYEAQLAAGFSDEDIQDYPTSELLQAMQEWVTMGKPI